jgi:coenzyme F420-reducing hydrogenase beta subunit
MISFDENGVLRFDEERCCQCGACLAGCAEGALSRRSMRDGRFAIVWEESRCTGCNACVAVCPAHDLPDRRWTDDSWDSVRRAAVGHAVDLLRRRFSSSGGVARTLVESALAGDLVDRAYCLVQDGQYPWAKGAYIERGFDISRIANSTYRPIPVLENCKPLADGARLLVVGLNCQLIGLQKYYARGRIELYRIGILCKRQKSELFTRFVRRRLGLPAAGTEPPSYRGSGWPGEMTVDGRRIAWAEAAALPFGKGLWTVPGCRYCANAFGDAADVTIADPWNIVTEAEADGGLSLVIVRSERGERLLERAGEAIATSPVDIEAVKRSIEWRRLRRKIDAIPARLGRTGGFAAMRIRTGDLARRICEAVLDRYVPPRLVLRLLARMPFPGP